jgi:phosphoglycerate kinase
MELGVLTLDDFDVKGKVILLRVDINSPIDRQSKRIKDDTRIQRTLPTLAELVERGARTVVLAHQGDPLDYQNFTDLTEHADRLRAFLDHPVAYLDDVAGPAARKRIQAMKDGELLLLENVRIHTEETIVFEESVRLSPEAQAQTYIVRNLAPLAEVFVCDAFAAAHRSEPTLVGLAQVLPSAAGRLFEQELRVLTQVRSRPERPCLFILGGAKILDAFKMMRAALEEDAADKVLTCGLTGEIMLIASNHDLGANTNALLEQMNLLEFVEPAREVLHTHKERVLIPEDVAFMEDSIRRERLSKDLPTADLIVDIGQRTIETYCREIEEAATIFVNGPAGIYEEQASSYGTRILWQAIADSPAFSVIGGGDSIAAANNFDLLDGFSYVCTAGGGLVRFLAGEELPVITALQESASRYAKGTNP